MLNLPSPQTVLPLDVMVPADLPELLPSAGPTLPGFAGLLAASAGALPAAAGPVDSAAVNPEATESPAIEQDWALALVPELANLPAEFVPPRAALPGLVPEPAPESGAAAGDMLGRGVAALNVGLPGPWPMRAVTSPRLSGLASAADPGRVRGWQNGVPSAPPLPTAPPTTPPTGEFILRNITGQPIPFPTDDQPPWYDPTQAPPWFDPANPPPPGLMPRARQPTRSALWLKRGQTRRWPRSCRRPRRSRSRPNPLCWQTRLRRLLRSLPPLPIKPPRPSPLRSRPGPWPQHAQNRRCRPQRGAGRWHRRQSGPNGHGAPASMNSRCWPNGRSRRSPYRHSPLLRRRHRWPRQQQHKLRPPHSPIPLPRPLLRQPRPIPPSPFPATGWAMWPCG